MKVIYDYVTKKIERLASDFYFNVFTERQFKPDRIQIEIKSGEIFRLAFPIR